MNKNQSNGSGLGLDIIGNLSSLLNDTQQNDEKTNGPLLLSLDKIVEDPNQPRSANNPGFSKESLSELAETIKLRGIKTPISVREIPNDENFMINHGARRYRAAKIAGLSIIPAFIDNDYIEADQVIENLQRNDLTPREIADYIGRELAKGKKKGEIAKDIGKSAAFIKQHATLLDLPEPIAVIFNNERVRDVTLINDLVTLYKKHSSEVELWLSDPEQEISRSSFKLFREFLINKSNTQSTDQGNTDGAGSDDSDPTGQDNTDGAGSDNSDPTGQDNTDGAGSDNSDLTGQDNTDGAGSDNSDLTGQADVKKSGSSVNDAHLDSGANKFKKAIVQVRHDDRLARLILTKKPQGAGFAWLKYDDDGQEIETDLNDVQLVAVIEG
jgi:ParB family chromosome partitioning protein